MLGDTLGVILKINWTLGEIGNIFNGMVGKEYKAIAEQKNRVVQELKKVLAWIKEMKMSASTGKETSNVNER